MDHARRMALPGHALAIEDLPGAMRGRAVLGLAIEARALTLRGAAADSRRERDLVALEPVVIVRDGFESLGDCVQVRPTWIDAGVDQPHVAHAGLPIPG